LKAWEKFHECFHTFGLGPGAGQEEFRSVHLCEAPGAFVTSLNHALVAHYPGTLYFYPVFRIRIHLIRIRIQHFRLITDPDSDPIRIQGFDQKLEKMYSGKKVLSLYQKLQFTYPQVSIKDVQVTEEALSSQKRTFSTSKHQIS
jgi:hypothetical protein